MKYLKYFNNHNIRESFQTQNTDNTLVHYCEDRNHLHYLNCDQNVENTPQEDTPVSNSDFNVITILDSFTDTFNISNINYVDENLNYIKKYYNVPLESGFIDEDDVQYPIFDGYEDYVYFGNSPSLTNDYIPSINGWTVENPCTGLALLDYTQLYQSIESSNTLSNIINNNIPLRIELYLGNGYLDFNLAPVEYGTFEFDNGESVESGNILIYMSMPESVNYADNSSWTDIPLIYALRIGTQLIMIFPFQQFNHTHINYSGSNGGGGGSYFGDF